MKTLFSIIMALFLFGCSDYGTDKAQQNEQQEEVGEMSDEASDRNEEMQEQETLHIPLAEDTNFTYENEADDEIISDE